MAFNLGLGLEALKGYQARDRQIKAEDYQDRQRDYGTAQMDAYQPGLQDAAAATSAANQLRTAQASAESSLLPKRVEVAGLHLGNQVSEEKFKAEQMPGLHQTERNNSALKLAESNQNIEMLPDKLNEEHLKGITSLQEARSKAFGLVPTSLEQGKASAIRYANAARESGLFGDLVKLGAKVVDIQHGKDENGKDAIFYINAEGGKFGFSSDQLAYFSQLGQKYDFKTIKDDESLVAIDPRTGKATKIFQGSGSPSKKYTKLPAEAALMDYMVEKGAAKDVKEAFEKIRTSRGKTREERILELIKPQLMPGQAPEVQQKIRETATALHDSVYGAQSPAGSNSGPANTLDPKVQSLFE